MNKLIAIIGVVVIVVVVTTTTTTMIGVITFEII